MDLPTCDCKCSNECDVEVENVGFLTGLMAIYKNNKHYFWPIYFIIVYLIYTSKSKTEEKRLPICKGTYSNECNVRDVRFLNDVKQFVNESGMYIITKGVTYFLHPLFQKLSFFLFLFSSVFTFIYPSISSYFSFSFFSFLFISTSLLLMFPSSYGSFYSNLLAYFGGGNFIHPCNEYKQEYNAFFAGLCYYCKIPGKPPKQPLQPCSGCQLVAYCSKNCMKINRSSHKYICEEFALVNGKNVLHTTGPWTKHITGLCERAARLPQAKAAAAKAIFRNPRVCQTCKEARSEQLTDCECACVSYCSKKCARVDKKHKEDCSHLSYIAQSYYLCVAADLLLLKTKSWFKKIQNSLTTECTSYPMSLFFALQSLPKHRLGSDQCPLEDITTLEVHVITSSPIFNSKSWEAGLMHQLPKLKQLNVVFIMQGKEFKPHFFYNIRLNGLSLLRCRDCEIKNRVITYSVQQMQYHMFFSSSEYTDPDVVVVFDNTHEMSLSEEDNIHSEISYRNMIYSRDTVLVLTDATKDLVSQGARAVNSAQPIDHLVSPRINQNKGIGSHRADLDSHSAIINEKYYFTCLRRK